MSKAPPVHHGAFPFSIHFHPPLRQPLPCRVVPPPTQGRRRYFILDYISLCFVHPSVRRSGELETIYYFSFFPSIFFCILSLSDVAVASLFWPICLPHLLSYRTTSTIPPSFLRLCSSLICIYFYMQLDSIRLKEEEEEEEEEEEGGGGKVEGKGEE